MWQDAARSGPSPARHNSPQSGRLNRSRASPPNLALYRAVDEILQYLSDPIGVASVPEARDEYHGYLPHVLEMLKSGSTEGELAEYLGSIPTAGMGLSANSGHDRAIARHLLNWKAKLGERQGR